MIEKSMYPSPAVSRSHLHDRTKQVLWIVILRPESCSFHPPIRESCERLVRRLRTRTGRVGDEMAEDSACVRIARPVRCNAGAPASTLSANAWRDHQMRGDVMMTATYRPRTPEFVQRNTRFPHTGLPTHTNGTARLLRCQIFCSLPLIFQIQVTTYRRSSPALRTPLARLRRRSRFRPNVAAPDSVPIPDATAESPPVQRATLSFECNERCEPESGDASPI
ncbi:hypothetical protein MSAN_00623900 [Mycena sanguinolenta]|uniref:Uncharacterized protein n=1 Tax=Mycena sanguinolenta TaxID=230812 RepID=A0A8H7DF58_9AGAR|nr:hypothetical protein MSAN_00623900 [Mycena sanguinolenta]